MSAIIMYENGHPVGGEGHPTDADDITFDNTGTDLVSENVESAIVEVNAKTSGLTRMTKLWTNPSPTASFSPQNVTLSDSDYDFLEVRCVDCNVRIFKDDTVGYLTSSIVYNSRFICTTRGVVANGATVTFQPAYRAQQSSAGSQITTAENNALNIPVDIYGIKII